MKKPNYKSEGNTELLRYFTQFPNIIDELGLDPYEFRLLLHYYRVGECWEGVRATAKKCSMSVGKVASVRMELKNKSLITIEPYGPDGVIIKLVDKTRENVAFFDRSPDGQGVHDMNGVFTESDATRSRGEHKNTNSKNTQLRIQDDTPAIVLSHFNAIRTQYGFRGEIHITDQRIKMITALSKKFKFTLPDFVKVITHKFEKWNADPKMRDYLTPETLFRPSNFPKYLEEVTALPDKDWTSQRPAVTETSVSVSQKQWPA